MVVALDIPALAVVALAAMVPMPTDLATSRVTHTQFQDLVRQVKGVEVAQVARPIPMAREVLVVLEFILHWRAMHWPAEAEEALGTPVLPIKEAAVPQVADPAKVVEITHQLRVDRQMMVLVGVGAMEIPPPEAAVVRG